jgi:hypothetical protein
MKHQGGQVVSELRLEYLTSRLLNMKARLLFITKFVYTLVCYEIKIVVNRAIFSVMTVRCESNYTSVKRRKRLFAILTSFLRRNYLSKFALYSNQLCSRNGRVRLNNVML